MNPDLVLCSHGTRDPAGQEVVRRLVAAVRLAARPFSVHSAVVDVEARRLPVVLEQIHRPVVVVPLLLSPGHHVHHDIAQAIRDHPCAVAARTLGPSWTWAQIGAERLIESGARPEDAIVLGASSSSDPRARSAVEEAAERLRSLWSPDVSVGYVGHTGPALRDVVEQARQRARRVVVSSYLLAPGHFQRQLTLAGADTVTGPLLTASPRREIIDLVLRRFDRAARTLDWRPPSAFGALAHP